MPETRAPHCQREKYPTQHTRPEPNTGIEIDSPELRCDGQKYRATHPQTRL